MLRFILNIFGFFFSWLTLGAVFCVIILGAMFWIYGRDLPNHETLDSYEPATISRVYSGEGRYKAELTRNDDRFMSLPQRVTKARQLGADVFLSLHADALKEGSATGTTVYTLSDTASDGAAAYLARQHDRADLLSGVDLSAQDDEIATVLMDMARLETDARSDMLAGMLVDGIAESVGRIRKRPHLGAGFTVCP